MDHPREPEVYVCYSDDDQRWIDELLIQLRPLKGRGLDFWTYKNISPGDYQKDEIKAAAIASAKVAVLLVSPNFFASDDIMGFELPRLLDAARQGDLTLLWLPESASNWQVTELKDFEPIHPPDKPLNTLDRADRQEALVEISQKILLAVEERRSLTNGEGQFQAQARREHPANEEGKLPARTVRYYKIAVGILAGAVLVYVASHANEWWGPKAPPTPLENRVINISVKERSLQQVFTEVAHQIGAVPAVDARLTGTLSVSMDGEVKDFMNEICYEAGKCTWKIQPGDPPALVVLPPGAAPLTTGGE